MCPLSREPGLSQAATRVLAEAIGPESNPGGFGIGRFMAALWNDDSRAAEVLRAAGYDAAAIGSDFPLADAAPDAASLLPALLAEARRVARRAGGEIEVATEHLLAGIAIASQWTAERLAARGLDLAILIEPTPQGLPSVSTPLLVEADSQLLEPTRSEDAAVGRSLDAAANRCREGLRVVEDYVRFQLDDAALCGQLKSIRHDLAGVLSVLNASEWIRFRDTRGDVGTDIHTPAERVRSSPEALATANFKRAEEALRTLEEFTKLRNPVAAASLESLRYRLYQTEQAVAVRRHAREALAHARLYLLLTDRLCPRGLGPVARAAMTAGVDVIQLREKDVSARRFLELARRLREWTREAGVLLIINDRPDIAAMVDADGVHLGQDDLPVERVRRIVGARSLIGVSTHSIEQAREALQAGADYLGVGPVFPSKTKSFEELPGLGFVKQAAAEIRIPWFAIGGITAENLADVIRAGGERIAVSAAITQADDPADAARALATTLRAPAT